MRFEFATAGRIVFGSGTLSAIGPIMRDLGRHALVVTGRDPQRAQRLRELLAADQIGVSSLAIPSEPTTDDVVRGVEFARTAGCDCVIGFGGGSALDAAKAIAALLTNGGEPLDYLEVIGSARPLTKPSAPCVAIPTTAGTGSEVTRNSVLTSRPHRLKVSLRSPHLLPRLALVDPELTLDLPPALTAATGLDALTQLIEPYVSPRANPLTDALCVDGITRAARSLRRAVTHGRDAAAREDLALASVLGGLALANAGLGAVHGFANPIGGMYSAPHGAICGALLPHVTAANVSALRARAPGSPGLLRYEHLARLLTGRGDASVEDGIRWLADLGTAVAIPPLAHYGLGAGDIPAICTAAAQATSMKANVIPLKNEELAAILQAALR